MLMRVKGGDLGRLSWKWRRYETGETGHDMVNRKKTVLILGTGSAQVDAIRYCKDLGHDVIGASYREEGPGLAEVSRFTQIDIRNKELLLDFARSNGVDVVYSIGSDLASISVAGVSEALGTPHYLPEPLATTLADKGAVRTILAQHDLSPVPFVVAGSLQELAAWEIYPAVIKPVDSQGQRGVCRVAGLKELGTQFQESVKHSSTGRVIVERYIAGKEISANAFVLDGEVVCCFTSDRFVVPGVPGGVPSGHRYPARLPEELQSRVRRLVVAAVRAFGVRNGPVYLQMKIEGAEVFIIEVAARLDGCHLWRLIKLSEGVDLLAMSFAGLGVGSAPLPEDRRHAPSTGAEELYLHFCLQPPGTAFSPPLRTITADTVCWEWYYRPGEVVRSINAHLEKTGYRIRRVPRMLGDEEP